MARAMRRLRAEPMWCAMALLSALCVMLAVINVALSLGNDGNRRFLAERQAVLAQAATFGRVNQSIVSALAQFAVRDHDEDMRALLASQGITASATPAPAAPK